MGTDPRKSDRHEPVDTGSDKYKIRTLEDRSEAHARRIEELEDHINTGKTTFSNLTLEMRYMKESLDAMKTVLGRLNWTVIVAVIGALLATVLKGHVST